MADYDTDPQANPLFTTDGHSSKIMTAALDNLVGKSHWPVCLLHKLLLWECMDSTLYSNLDEYYHVFRKR